MPPLVEVLPYKQKQRVSVSTQVLKEEKFFKFGNCN
jgi:hypothetical protein